LMKLSRSAGLEVVRRLLAAVADHFVFDHLPLVERAQSGALDRGDMDEHVSAGTAIEPHPRAVLAGNDAEAVVLDLLQPLAA
jgi:hypothetical protein